MLELQAIYLTWKKTEILNATKFFGHVVDMNFLNTRNDCAKG